MGYSWVWLEWMKCRFHTLSSIGTYYHNFLTFSTLFQLSEQCIIYCRRLTYFFIFLQLWAIFFSTLNLFLAFHCEHWVETPLSRNQASTKKVQISQVKNILHEKQVKNSKNILTVLELRKMSFFCLFRQCSEYKRSLFNQSIENVFFAI